MSKMFLDRKKGILEHAQEPNKILMRFLTFENFLDYREKSTATTPI